MLILSVISVGVFVSNFGMYFLMQCLAVVCAGDMNVVSLSCFV